MSLHDEIFLLVILPIVLGQGIAWFFDRKYGKGRGAQK